VSEAPSRLGKYEVQGVLGKGAMGIVYKAHDPHIERTVAIKTVRKDLIDADLAASFLARFKNEARAAGRLQHPNIVAVYEYGEADDIAYIVMEYVDGIGLREYLNRKARFEFPQIVAILTQLLAALEFAHSQGVVHRDIKPANLILTSSGALKVADFGIARVDASNLTMTGMVLGTPSYMAPEQCQGLPSDHRADLFSVGVVLYELLTGVKPFEGSIESITYRICHEDARPPSALSALTLPPSVDALLATALAKRPEDRFQHARAFQFALRLAIGDALPSTGGEATVMNLDQVPLQAGPHAWDDALLATAERQLVKYVGPMARIFVRQAAAQAHDSRELYALLAEHIDDSEGRARFARLGASDASGSRPTTTSAVARSGTRASTRGTSTPTGTRPPRTLDQALIDRTTTRLAVFMGPIARVVARKAAEQARDGDDFVRLVAAHLGTQERDTFVRDIESGER